jgi:hypothetical protein
MAAVTIEHESAAAAAAADAAARALETLHGIVHTWLRDEPFHLYVAGSYRLGTLPIGDIDVVLVVRAATVPRARIFTELCGILQSHSSVTQLSAVPRARVPLLGFFIDGQEFDLLTCHLCMPRDAPWPSREHVLESYAALNGADDASVIALSGARVTEWLCSRLLTHFVAFRDAVQTLRAWAKRRALYSNKSGFLGGINLVLLAAVSVVQLTRSRSTDAHLTSSAVVAHTFKMCATRKWGARTPPLEIDGEYERRNATCPVFLYALDWDAHAATATDAMVLLTPCFPRTNSLYAVTSHTAAVLRHEFRRAHAVLCGHDPTPLAAPLAEMQTCTQVLRVTITAPCHSTGRQWLGYMQAQIRHVMRYVHEQATQLGIRAFRHIPCWYDTSPTSSVSTPTCASASTVAIAEPVELFASYATHPHRRGSASVEAIVEYFVREHAAAGPVRPPGTSVHAELVPAAHISDAVIAAALNIPPEELVRKPSASASASALTSTPTRITSTPTPTPKRITTPKMLTILRAADSPVPTTPLPVSRLRIKLPPWFLQKHARLVRVSAAPVPREACTYVGPAWPARGLAASPLWNFKNDATATWRSNPAVHREILRIAHALPHTLWCPCAALRTCHIHALADVIKSLQTQQQR